jgi:hypothetical protein
MAKTTTPPVHDDAGMIRQYDTWPRWPFLPLKRKNHNLKDKNLGVLLATQEHADAVKGSGKFRVYHVYMFQPPKGKAEWDAAPRTEYDTVEAMLADGWIVD